MTPLKDRIESARYHALAMFRWQRILGLSLTAVVFYFVIFVAFGKTDVSWMLPKVVKHFQWPDLPRFSFGTEKTSSGQDEAVYTVPTRKLTREELAQLSATNAAPTSPSAR